MPALSQAHRSAAGRVAALTRSRQVDDPELVDARRNLRAERLAAYIEKVVAQAPPLTKAQEDKLVTILRREQGVAQ